MNPEYESPGPGVELRYQLPRVLLRPDEGLGGGGRLALFHLKRCRGACGELLPVSKFYRRSGSNGHRHACIRCLLSAKHGYSIDNETYDALIIAQTGRCAICETQFSDEVLPCVDHCHETKRVRGILCPGCNLGLGYLKDDPRRLSAAARYVEA